jgi:hypothetical protein
VPLAADPAIARVTLRSDIELEQLLAPIALYPDALIAIILPAATASTDIVLAARQLRASPGDTSQIEHRAWDESVKSLAYYPEVLTWMDENLPWTKQVGDAFTHQPADVMQAIQRLRAQARAAGTLNDTPQQQVITEPDVIRIVPAQPEVIYVPRYEPDVVFVREAYYPVAPLHPLVTFGAGLRVGSWLAYECDWRRRTIWIGDRYRPWRGHDWRRPVVHVSAVHPHAPTPGVRPWRPTSRQHFATHYTVNRGGVAVVRPAPLHSPHPRGSNPGRDRRVDAAPPSQAPLAGPVQTPAGGFTARSAGAHDYRARSGTHRVPPLPTQLHVTDPGAGASASAPIPRGPGARSRSNERGSGAIHLPGGGVTSNSPATPGATPANRTPAFERRESASPRASGRAAPPAPAVSPRSGGEGSGAPARGTPQVGRGSSESWRRGDSANER